MSAKTQMIQASIVPLAFAAFILAMTTCVNAKQKSALGFRQAVQVGTVAAK